MIDLKLIRDNPIFLDEALKKRGQDGLSATVLKLDKENREIIKELQTVQEERNEKSKKLENYQHLVRMMKLIYIKMKFLILKLNYKN